MLNNQMSFDPVTCDEKPYPNNPLEYRKRYGNIAWLYNPYTGEKRHPLDIGSDVTGLLIYNTAIAYIF